MTTEEREAAKAWRVPCDLHPVDAMFIAAACDALAKKLELSAAQRERYEALANAFAVELLRFDAKVLDELFREASYG